METRKRQVVIIIGAMKAGTTSLHYYLSEHPNIVSAKKKEIHFFSSNFEKGHDWYQQHWPEIATDCFGLEASPTYSMLPNLPDSVMNMKKSKAIYDFKLIYVLRNPLDRIQSHINHLLADVRLRRGAVSADDIERQKSKAELIDFSKYAFQLKPYAKVFSQDELKLVVFEDLIARPTEVLKDLCSFLQIDPDIEFSRINAIRNSSKAQRLPLSIHKLLHTKFGAGISRKISPSMRTFILKLVAKDNYLSCQLSAESRQLFLNELIQDLQILKSEFGVDSKTIWSLDPEDEFQIV